jgi:hypothetical protein
VGVEKAKVKTGRIQHPSVRTRKIDMTTDSRDEAEQVTELVPGDVSASESRGSPDGPWRSAIGGLLGVSKPKGIPAPEVAAVYAFVEELRADLAAPPTAADEATLASLARVSLLELRFSRAVFSKGGITRAGDVKGVTVELRQLVRLKVDLLAKLRFRSRRTREKRITDARLVGTIARRLLTPNPLATPV